MVSIPNFIKTVSPEEVGSIFLGNVGTHVRVHTGHSSDNHCGHLRHYKNRSLLQLKKILLKLLYNSEYLTEAFISVSSVHNKNFIIFMYLPACVYVHGNTFSID
jgi:hypothetical protein